MPPRSATSDELVGRAEFTTCRGFTHEWHLICHNCGKPKNRSAPLSACPHCKSPVDYASLRNGGGSALQLHWRCPCGTKRITRTKRNGYAAGTKYDYAEDYLRKGLGRIKRADVLSALVRERTR